jgi:predicted transcriptional regulator
MRARWNEVTGKILALLKREEMDADTVSKHLQSNGTKASVILLKLYRQGSVNRKSVKDGEIVLDKDEDITRPRYVYVYSITDQGLERLSRIRGEAKPRLKLAANPKEGR